MGTLANSEKPNKMFEIETDNHNSNALDFVTQWLIA